MKVFITGGTGFIGRHLMRRMAKTEHELFCLARITSDTRELHDLGAHIVIGDVTDRASLREGMRCCDWVFNLANVHSFWEPDKEVYRRVNVLGTRNVMECALEAGVSKVVHLSSVIVWGKPDISPFTEETSAGMGRFSDYTRTKYEGDLVAWQLYREDGLPLVVLYPCMVLGAGDNKASGETIRRFIERRLPATIFPESIVTFVHVRDVAEAIVKAAEKENNIGQKYIIGSARLSMGEVYSLLREVSGAPVPNFRIPDNLAIINAQLLTWLADKIKRPPLWGMAIDFLRSMQDGLIADGGKAERELGLVYTPIRQAIEEEVTWHRMSMSERLRARQARITPEARPNVSAGSERRSQSRQPVDLMSYVEGLSHGQETDAEARITNLSRLGLYVESEQALDEGTEARITAIRYGAAFWVKGTVLRSTDKGMAIGFAGKVPIAIERIIETGW